MSEIPVHIYALFSDATSSKVVAQVWHNPNARSPIDADISGPRNSALVTSARWAVSATAACLQDLDVLSEVLGLYFTFSFPNSPAVEIVGNSAGLAFCLECGSHLILQPLHFSGSLSIAATGRLSDQTSDAMILEVGDICEKIRASLQIEGIEAVIYPQDNDREINAELRQETNNRGVQLLPVSNVKEAIRWLCQKMVTDAPGNGGTEMETIEELPVEVQVDVPGEGEKERGRDELEFSCSFKLWPFKRRQIDVKFNKNPSTDIVTVTSQVELVASAWLKVQPASMDTRSDTDTNIFRVTVRAPMSFGERIRIISGALFGICGLVTGLIWLGLNLTPSLLLAWVALFFVGLMLAASGPQRLLAEAQVIFDIIRPVHYSEILRVQVEPQPFPILQGLWEAIESLNRFLSRLLRLLGKLREYICIWWRQIAAFAGIAALIVILAIGLLHISSLKTWVHNAFFHMEASKIVILLENGNYQKAGKKLKGELNYHLDDKWLRALDSELKQPVEFSQITFFWEDSQEKKYKNCRLPPIEIEEFPSLLAVMSGAGYGLRFVVKEDANLYVLQLDPSNKLFLCFPNAKEFKTAEDPLLKAGQPYQIPAPRGAYTLDTVIGTERIIFVATPWRCKDIEKLYRQYYPIRDSNSRKAGRLRDKLLQRCKERKDDNLASTFYYKFTFEHVPAAPPGN